MEIKLEKSKNNTGESSKNSLKHLNSESNNNKSEYEGETPLLD